MSGDIYYLLASLESLDELGSTPPISLTDLLDRVEESGGNVDLIKALFLSDDLQQRQACLSGELEEFDPVVLSEAQIKGMKPLPSFLIRLDDEGDLHSNMSLLWANYYRYVLDMAKGRQGSEFLKKWVSFEVGLRNALVVARSKVLGTDPYSYIVAEEMGSSTEEFEGIIAEWSSASNPLEGLRSLDQARWHWICRNEDWFSFSDNELAAYAAKLILLKRWKRLGKETSRKI